MSLRRDNLATQNLKPLGLLLSLLIPSGCATEEGDTNSVPAAISDGSSVLSGHELWVLPDTDVRVAWWDGVVWHQAYRGEGATEAARDRVNPTFPYMPTFSFPVGMSVQFSLLDADDGNWEHMATCAFDIPGGEGQYWVLCENNVNILLEHVLAGEAPL